MMTSDMSGLLTSNRPTAAVRSAAPTDPPRSAAAARRVMVASLAGALAMLVMATLNAVGGPDVPVLSTIATLPGGPAAAVAGAPPAPPGLCLSWSRPDAADTAVVDCAQPHLFEQAGPLPLTDQVTLPDDRLFRQLVGDRCTPLVLGYLGNRFDPVGRYRVGALKPSPAMWDSGDHNLRCGLQSASRSGAMLPTIGRVAQNEQSNIHDAGTCLALDGRSVGDPVACGGPHAVETVGIVDLSTKFAGGYPAVNNQDSFLQASCTKIANDYGGGADALAKKNLTVYWDNLAPESWNAGSRKVNCNLAALLPDKSGFAPVTGSVKG